MSNMEATVLAINSLLGLSINAIMAVQQYQATVDKARAEGRDISDAELAEIKAQNHALTNQVLADLS